MRRKLTNLRLTSTANLLTESRCGAGRKLKLEKIQRGNVLSGIVPGKLVRVVAAEMLGADALELTYKIDDALGQRLLSRADEDGVLLASDRPRAMTQAWRRLAAPKFASTLVVLIALALAANHFWFRRPPKAEGPASNDMPVVIRTNGGMLEVATVKHRRTFNLTQMWTVLGYPIDFCKESASYTVDTYITYRVKLAKRWYASYERQRLIVTAPKLEPKLPVAFDTSKLKLAIQKCPVVPSMGTQNDLLQSISASLEKDARSPNYINFARDNGARDTVREFVQKWLVSQKGYNIPPNAPIDVEFDGE